MNFIKSNVCTNVCNSSKKLFHTSCLSFQIYKTTRLRVVDNSTIGKEAMLEGRPPKVIHVYNRTTIGKIGDKVLLAIKGQMKKGIIVGCVQYQNSMVPRFDTNNVVLIDDNGNPLGNRIHVPIPTHLRKILADKTFPKQPDYTKLLSIATKFV